LARTLKIPQIDEEERFLVRVAWACEIEGLTQARAAERFQVTRLRVNQALGEARRRGIVRVSINSSYGLCAEAEARLGARFGLDHACVAPNMVSDDMVQAMVGYALGLHLSDVLSDPAVKRFGMSWGNTLNMATRSLKSIDRPDLEIVSVMGGLTRGSDLNILEITTRLANMCNASLSYLTAPLYAGSHESQAILVDQDVFRKVIDKIRGADALAMAAGDMSERSMLIRDGLPSDIRRADLEAAGAVGDVLGYFLNAKGELIDHPVNSRVIGFELEDLRAIPDVILAAGGRHKVPIIRAALSRGLINTLVTDEETAFTLLEEEPA
jgi:DNA-binding transcriptional regulator LsrR (DeoR family)